MDPAGRHVAACVRLESVTMVLSLNAKVGDMKWMSDRQIGKPSFDSNPALQSKVNTVFLTRGAS